MSDAKSQPKKRILLVDDHPLLREGIAQLIGMQPDLQVCGEAGDPAGALALLAHARPDLAVVDLSLKEQSGLALIKDFQVRAPQMPVLVLSMHDEQFYAERALRAGARGYIMKREASHRVLAAIRHILGGGIYVSDPVVSSILGKASGRHHPARPAPLAALSDRELDVLLLLGKGFGTQAVADQLHISIKTVETHRANLKHKLKLHTSSELLQCAIRWTHELGAA